MRRGKEVKRKDLQNLTCWRWWQERRGGHSGRSTAYCLGGDWIWRGGGRSKDVPSAYLLPWLRVALGFQDLRAGKRDQ